MKVEHKDIEFFKSLKGEGVHLRAGDNGETLAVAFTKAGRWLLE